MAIVGGNGAVGSVMASQGDVAEREAVVAVVFVGVGGRGPLFFQLPCHGERGGYEEWGYSGKIGGGASLALCLAFLVLVIVEVFVRAGRAEGAARWGFKGGVGSSGRLAY